MKINSNMQALQASGILQANESAFSKSTEKLSSGYKINSSRDDPVGLAISNKMGAKSSSLKKANNNSVSGVSVVQTADGAMQEIRDIIHRIKELSVRSANGTNTDSDRRAMQEEVNNITAELNNIVEQTEYNGQKLLNGNLGVRGNTWTGSYNTNTGISLESYNNRVLEGSNRTFKVEDVDGVPTVTEFSGFPYDEGAGGKFTTDPVGQTFTYTDKDGNQLVMNYRDDVAKDQTINLDVRGQGDMIIQVGSESGQEINITIPDLSLSAMGIGEIDISTADAAKSSMAKLDTALDYVSRAASKIGAIQNRFEANISNLNVTDENLTESYSTLRDTNMASEMVEYTRLQILTQAGVSILSQANELPQQALQLLQ
ncbi:MAG: hypothetical protein K5770_09165 [Lachnospiraceae bacterium]|nr:hypothetical protein [Lachnospiraceae bacterium]